MRARRARGKPAPRSASAKAARRVPKGLVTSIPRLFLYHRTLEDAVSARHLVLTSQELATRVGRGISSTQIRKDLSCLGQFGCRGQGYEVATLIEKLSRILGLDRDWSIAIAGFGNLGRALAAFMELREEKFHIAAIFDADPKLVGTQWHGLTIHHIDEMERILPPLRCSIGIIAVPAAAAQAAAAKLMSAGIAALLNFAPTALAHSNGVAIRSIDLASELSILTHHLA